MTLNHRYPIKTGMTLIEIMVALTMTLIILGAMMTAFDFASKEMAKGRAVIEMSNQMRAAEELLRSDLNGLTVDVRPATFASQPSGYFEYIEGPGTDDTLTVLGDVDDILCMTIRSEGEPFRGRYNGQVIESDLAEVVWFVLHNDPNRPYRDPATGYINDNDRNNNDLIDFDESIDVYRRVLLIRPDLSNDPSWVTTTMETDFFNLNDISVRPGTSGATYDANTLADLTKRENRLARNAGFPYVVNFFGPNSLIDNRMGSYDTDDNLVYTGEDIVLTNIAAFDIQVFSANANVVHAPVTDGGAPQVNVFPGSEYDTALMTAGAISSELGAFINLGLGAVGGGDFVGLPDTRSGWVAGTEPFYCTWSGHYELGRQGANGIDDDGMNGIDDVGERETMPPYLDPIRGIRIRLRMIEKKSNLVRQSSVIHSFVPQ